MVATKQQREVSPIPPGRYWLTLIGPANVRDFDTWVRDMSGAVRVNASETQPGSRGAFVIFTVPEGRSPFLNAQQFGFPNTAPDEVRFQRDVEQAPDPEGLPSLSDLAFGGIGSPLILLVLAAVVLSNVGGQAVRRSTPRRRYA